jgi:hypothetical protein
MKKLSTLIAILLIATIGGVYATWNYSQGTVISKTAYFDDVTKITDKVVDNAKGVIEITKNDLAITIDDANNNHYAEWSVAGSLTVKFTPNSGADETVKLNGIDLQWSLLTTNSGTGNVTWVYENVNIFFVKTDAVTLAKGAATKQGDSFVWTINASDLVPHIAFYNTEYSATVNKVSEIDTENPGNSVYNDSNLYLNTVARYDAFKLALHSGTIGITVAEKTA